jgi:putative hydrolase of the HAD superfamily
VIKVVTFDADGTLWDFERVMREAFALVLAKLRDHVPRHAGALTVDDLIRIRERVAGERAMQQATHEQIRLASFVRTLEELGCAAPSLALQLTDLYLRHRFEGIRLFDDVELTLDRLVDYRLGIVSNGNSYPDRCELPGRFQFTAFAQEHGARKPDRRLFEAAVHLAACRPEEILHVGDSLEDDVAGAKPLGIRTVWINRARQSNLTSIKPDFEIHTLLDLPVYLR